MDVVTLQAAKAAAKLDAARRYPAPADVQVFNITSATWQKPAGAKFVEVLVIDGGGGGGSGRRGAAGTVRCGGGGGGGGGSTLARFRASDLPDTVTVTVGAGGAGGAAVTVDSTDGAAGSGGGRSSFGTYVRTAVGANGGGAGTATSGVTSGSSANAGGTGPSLAGAAASTTGGVGVSGGGQGSASSGHAYAGCGGGSGGGITSADVANNGGTGGAAAYTINSAGAAGVVDTTQPTTANAPSPGPGAGGGGGGAASKTAAAQAGAVGGKYGAGGGGGGASLNGFASGAGGTGGSGVVVVTSYFDVLSDSAQWVAWGDSLTAGTGGGGTTITTVLAGLIGKTVTNQGVGGETSTQIAGRSGGSPITVAAVTIAASGATTVVPTPSLVSAQGSPLTGTLGGIRGTLAYSGGIVTFTRTETVAASTALAAGSVFIPDPGQARRVDRQIIWVGRNNYTVPSTVVADAAAIAAQSVPGKYIVLSVLNGSYPGVETSGSSGYTQILATNAALSAAFGTRYLDIRSYLISNGLADAAITPTAQDLLDIAADVVPSSLRSDQIHLNAAGYTVVAQRIQAKLTALGY